MAMKDSGVETVRTLVGIVNGGIREQPAWQLLFTHTLALLHMPGSSTQKCEKCQRRHVYTMFSTASLTGKQ